MATKARTSLLLDTHAFLWMQACPERFKKSTLKQLEKPETRLFLSAVSTWEIAIKWQLKKLELPFHPAEYVPKRMQTSNIEALAISHQHALQVARLPDHHADPFDRLLVATAQLENLPVVTSDRILRRYKIKVVSA